MSRCECQEERKQKRHLFCPVFRFLFFWSSSATQHVVGRTASSDTNIFQCFPHNLFRHQAQNVVSPRTIAAHQTPQLTFWTTEKALSETFESNYSSADQPLVILSCLLNGACSLIETSTVTQRVFIEQRPELPLFKCHYSVWSIYYASPRIHTRRWWSDEDPFKYEHTAAIKAYTGGWLLYCKFVFC